MAMYMLAHFKLMSLSRELVPPFVFYFNVIMNRLGHLFSLLRTTKLHYQYLFCMFIDRVSITNSIYASNLLSQIPFNL